MNTTAAKKISPQQRQAQQMKLALYSIYKRLVWDMHYANDFTPVQEPKGKIVYSPGK